MEEMTALSIVVWAEFSIWKSDRNYDLRTDSGALVVIKCYRA